MSNTNTGGPAFPSHGSMGEVTHEGMTLRDYFAAKAMQTYMINEVWNPDTYKGAAITAYRVADAMLAARSQA
jgi:hypothetical protein